MAVLCLCAMEIRKLTFKSTFLKLRSTIRTGYIWTASFKNMIQDMGKRRRPRNNYEMQTCKDIRVQTYGKLKIIGYSYGQQGTV